MLQLILVGLCYLMSSEITNGGRWIKKYFFRPGPPSNREAPGVNMKSLLFKVAAGIICLLIVDLASATNPWWPALTLVAVLTGELFPLTRSELRPEVGIIYFGGIFYLYPLLALAGLLLAVQILIFSNDRMLTGLTFMGSIPILFCIGQINPLFLIAAIVDQFLIYFYFRTELWHRVVRRFKY